MLVLNHLQRVFICVALGTLVIRYVCDMESHHIGCRALVLGIPSVEHLSHWIAPRGASMEPARALCVIILSFLSFAVGIDYLVHVTGFRGWFFTGRCRSHHGSLLLLGATIRQVKPRNRTDSVRARSSSWVWSRCALECMRLPTTWRWLPGDHFLRPFFLACSGGAVDFPYWGGVTWSYHDIRNAGLCAMRLSVPPGAVCRATRAYHQMLDSCLRCSAMEARQRCSWL